MQRHSCIYTSVVEDLTDWIERNLSTDLSIKAVAMR